VLTPGYGHFHKLPGAKFLGSVSIDFRLARESVAVYEVPGSTEGVTNIVFDHKGFESHGANIIYSEDGPTRPFATDANKFALFGAAAAAWIHELEEAPDVVHLHDWHAAFYLLMRHYAEHYEALCRIPTVFTIHNLSYQGMRPLKGDESSLEAWFPGLGYLPQEVGDPHHADCINPMAMAIRMADRISTVSPTYAREICRPSDPDHGFVGGEGLEGLLTDANAEGRLVGILNGCYYDGPKGRRPGWQRVLGMIDEQLQAWPDTEANRLAARTLAGLPKRRPPYVMTSIGRLVSQKASLFVETVPGGAAAIDAILDALGRRGILIMLGSGEYIFEYKMLEAAKRHDNLLFLRGYSETLADPLYRVGDLFLMPSSFEPCGISQMLAMRAAQPCVVHGVGGLRDTVDDMRSGFVFDGATTGEQAGRFVDKVLQALELKTNDHDEWQKICIRAANARFSWSGSARATIEQLYEQH
jgi:starch synthase